MNTHAPAFNLERTLHSGQVFHWVSAGKGWKGLMGSQLATIIQHGEWLEIHGVSEAQVRHYFSLDHPLEEMIASMPNDPTMQAAIAACPGLRIIRQPYWECVATFITSTQKAAPHITQMSHALRQRFGTATEEGLAIYPTPQQLAARNIEEVRACSLGYRAANLLKAAKQIAANEVNLEAIASMKDDDALAELCKLGGVGPKVANCILLFAYERLRAFPIDVWIERVLRQYYFKGKRNVTAKRLREFAATYFGPYGGYAQQYLFHYARITRLAE